MSKTRINAELLDAISNPEKKDRAIKGILLDLDDRISKLQRNQLVTSIILVIVLLGKDVALKALAGGF